MTDFDYNKSFEFLAERFYSETGFMAPGKNVAPEMAYSDEDNTERSKQWGEFMKDRNREAWVLWHQEYGYLKEHLSKEES